MSKTELHFSISIYYKYTTEEGHRSVQKLWSFLLLRIIALKCHSYALDLIFIYVHIYLMLTVVRKVMSF